MKASSNRERATLTGLVLLLVLILIATGTLTRWTSGDSSTASADELAQFYDPYPARLPFIAFDPPPTATPVPTAAPVPTATPIPPEPVIFLGERNAWDAIGYIRLDDYSEAGFHRVMEFDAVTGPDIIRGQNNAWYDPNPHGWEEENWEDFYSISTGTFLSTSAISDPAWKFGYYRILPLDKVPESGKLFYIDGEPFTVGGPYGGVTAFGQPVNFWLLENTQNILYMSDSSGLSQVVRPGNLELHYDAGSTRLLLFSDVLRHIYYFNSSTGYNVQYVTKLTYSNAFNQNIVNVAQPPPPTINDEEKALQSATPSEPTVKIDVRLVPLESLQWRPPVQP